MGSLSSAGKRVRGSKGQKLRKRRMARSHWLCMDCLNSTPRVIRTADVVDHIAPLTQGGEDTDENTRNLCNECHERRTAEQFGRSVKAQIGEDGWPVT